MSRPWCRPRLWQGAWALMILAVVVGSLLPSRELPTPLFPQFDKAEHFAGYFVLAAYAAMLFERGRPVLRGAFALVLLGVAIEIAQGLFTRTRAADPVDALTNALGVAAGTRLAWTRANAWLHRLDRRLFGRRLAPM